MVVKNLESKIKDYEKFNIKPWDIYDFEKEDDLKIKAKMAFSRVGNIILKLIEPKNDSLFSDFLSKNGEGIHHLKMEVNDYQKAMKYLLSKGIKVIYSGNYREKINFSFIDTAKNLNFITEISDKEFIKDDPGYIVHP